MCSFLSAIITRDYDIWANPGISDSHEDIIRSRGLVDSGGLGSRHWVRVEYRPPADRAQILDLSLWTLRIDEESAPEWLDPDRARSRLADYVRSMIVADHRERLDAGCWILGPGAEIGAVGGTARVVAVLGGRIDEVSGGTIGVVSGGAQIGVVRGGGWIGVVRDGRIDVVSGDVRIGVVSGGTIGVVSGGTIGVVRGGGWIEEVSGGVIGAVRGGVIGVVTGDGVIGAVRGGVIGVVTGDGVIGVVSGGVIGAVSGGWIGEVSGDAQIGTITGGVIERDLREERTP